MVAREGRRQLWPSGDAIDGASMAAFSHATLDYVDWFNHRRLHGELGMLPASGV